MRAIEGLNGHMNGDYVEVIDLPRSRVKGSEKRLRRSLYVIRPGPAVA